MWDAVRKIFQQGDKPVADPPPRDLSTMDPPPSLPQPRQESPISAAPLTTQESPPLQAPSPAPTPLGEEQSAAPEQEHNLTQDQPPSPASTAESTASPSAGEDTAVHQLAAEAARSSSPEPQPTEATAAPQTHLDQEPSAEITNIASGTLSSSVSDEAAIEAPSSGTVPATEMDNDSSSLPDAVPPASSVEASAAPSAQDASSSPPESESPVAMDALLEVNAPTDTPDSALADDTAAGKEAATAPPDESEAAGAAALQAGITIAERYTIVAVDETAVPEGGVRAYRATDIQAFTQCWSCGSTANSDETRFCQNCGAPIRDHQVTLIETATSTGASGEIEYEGRFLYVLPERRQFGAAGVGVEIGSYSAEGPHHPNEDSVWYTITSLCANSGRSTRAVALLADGMGGYRPGSGLISSRVVSSAGAHILEGVETLTGDESPEDAAIQLEGMVRDGITVANSMVLEEVARTGEMGATLVTVVIHGENAYIANIGDSRAYYIDPSGQSSAVTRDQSLVAQEVIDGGIAAADIYTAPGNNIILHAIGEQYVEEAADWYVQPLEPGSMLLLCTDGFWKTMRGEISSELLHGSTNLTDASRRLVEDALGHGSDDNTTVVLIGIS